MCVNAFLAYIHICVPRACLVSMEAEEGSGSHGTGVTGGCEALSPCKSSRALQHWAFSLAPDLELLVLLNG